MHDDDDSRKPALLGAIVASAAKVLAPNSLQFNEREFQLSSHEAQEAARNAAALVQPGDLIFITTSGLLYSMGRYAADSDYDHVVVVLDDSTVLHVGPPSARVMPLERLLLPARQPVVFRVPMTDIEREKFVRCARELVGCKYDVTRAYQLILRLTLKHMTSKTPLKKLPMDVRSDSWICSDSIIVLLAGCSDRFRAALVQARKEAELGILQTLSLAALIASLSDFIRIRRIDPEVMQRVDLPVVNYTLSPQKKPLRAYLPDLIRTITRIQSGSMRWPLIEEVVMPRLQAITDCVPLPSHWTMHQKSRVLGYSIVLLVLVRQGRTVRKILLGSMQLLLARFLLQQLVLHLGNRQQLLQTLVAKL